MYDWKTAVVVGWIFGILFMLVSLAFNIGKMKGYDQAYESRKRTDCEIEFSGTPYKDIDGRCLKYFVEKGE